MTQPAIYMIAGPNGAGKTTLAYEALPRFLSANEFVNADEIARGLSPFNSEGQAMAAGKLMLQRIENLIAARTPFAFETTAASHVFAEKLKRARHAGYLLGLFYVWLPDAEMAKRRVKLRVSQGGHHVPDETVERRYRRGLANLVNLYLPLFDKAEIYNGTVPRASEKRLIAEKNADGLRVCQAQIWYGILENANRSV